MLREAFTHLTTPCAEPWRAMGYLRELIAIDARHRRCHAAWQPHVARTEALITSAADATTARSKAVVLGAGILADIPLRALASMFETVVLVDVCFLRTTRRRAKTFANVRLETADITGAAAALHAWADAGAKMADRPGLDAPNMPSVTGADLVISANVLSQLPLTPLHYLRRRAPHLTEGERTALARDLVRAHLAMLAQCTGVVCLITEVAREFRTDDNVRETEDPLWGVTVDPGTETWTWDVAPRGEASNDFSIHNRVTGRYWPPS